MRVLVSGRGGGSGSWLIRGVQLGQAIGATVEASANVIKGYDLVVVVKRPRPDLVYRVKQAGVPLVWDVVDSWPQPEGNVWDELQCLTWLEREINSIRPQAIVAATKSMADDCKRFGVPVLTLPHHVRPGLKRNPIRDRKNLVVGYEGGPQYLGWWFEFLDKECSRRGWSFVISPQSLTDLDIVVAMREQGGYAPLHWKSNVKLANAQGSGTPCVINRECGYLETASGAEKWASNQQEMLAALDALEPLEERRAVSEKLYSAAPWIDQVASEYKAWLSALKF